MEVVNEQDIVVDDEHELNEECVESYLSKDIIDKHLENLLDEIGDECNNLDEDVERMISEIEFNLQ